ncbi:hypothetical protein [Pantoea sp. BAV 3049]|uniref:hypothetical protein n=1 Tax=Pantoea sp. BAV 3049 TaxID=2654188 RepID=UPI00131D629C|nr:hypothetical protein [Pantoea sp. BAV 3049]
MGFPSPATDYTEERPNLNAICRISPTSQLYEHNGDIYVIDRAVPPGRGDEFIYELYGEVGLGKMMGKSLITSDGDYLEGSVLEEVITLGAVMFKIRPLHEDSRPVI